MTVKSEVVTGDEEVIGRVRNTVFAYEPSTSPPPAARATATPATNDGGDGVAGEVRPKLEADARVGEQLALVEFPLSIYRLVMQAGANRDLNSIHHNSEYAKASGAPEMYASTSFLLGMWERAVRDFIGLEGTIRSIRGFRMKKFNPVGTTTVVRGKVLSAAEADGVGVLELSVWCENGGQVTVGPGVVTVAVPKPG